MLTESSKFGIPQFGFSSPNRGKRNLASRFHTSFIMWALKTSRKAGVYIFILSVLKNHHPNQFKIHLVKKKEMWGFLISTHLAVLQANAN